MVNIISAGRIILSISLLLITQFSPAFYALRLTAVSTDIIDVALARKTTLSFINTEIFRNCFTV